MSPRALNSLLLVALTLAAEAPASAAASEPTPEQCRQAQEVGKEFSLAVVNGKLNEAFALTGGAKFKTAEELEKHAKKQLRHFYGKEVFFSLQGKEANRAFCIRHGNGKKRYLDARVYLLFDHEKLGNGVARVMAVSFHLEWEGGRWKVHDFSSTAM